MSLVLFAGHFAPESVLDYNRRLPSTLPRIETPQGFESNWFGVAFPASDGNTQYTEERRGLSCGCVYACDDHWLVVDSSSSAGDPFVLEICFLHASCCFCLCLSVCDCGSVLRALSMY